jgi:hypothetical protein
MGGGSNTLQVPQSGIYDSTPRHHLIGLLTGALFFSSSQYRDAFLLLLARKNFVNQQLLR